MWKRGKQNNNETRKQKRNEKTSTTAKRQNQKPTNKHTLTHISWKLIIDQDLWPDYKIKYVCWYHYLVTWSSKLSERQNIKRLPYAAQSTNYSPPLAHDSKRFTICHKIFLITNFDFSIRIILPVNIFTFEKVNHPFSWKATYI